MAPPVTAPLDGAPDAQGRDSVDVWLAAIEDKAADAAKALAVAARKEAEEPSAWRERWAPNDLVTPPERDRPTRYRIRIGAGARATERPSAASRTGSRQFVAVLLTMIVIVLLAFAGPSIVRRTLRVVVEHQRPVLAAAASARRAASRDARRASARAAGARRAVLTTLRTSASTTS